MVNEKKIRSNLDVMKALTLAEPVMFALATKGWHQEGYKIIYEICMKAHESGQAFKEDLLAGKRVASYLYGGED